jgi:DNA polymerase II large subunit
MPKESKNRRRQGKAEKQEEKQKKEDETKIKRGVTSRLGLRIHVMSLHVKRHRSKGDVMVVCNLVFFLCSTS